MGIELKIPEDCVLKIRTSPAPKPAEDGTTPEDTGIVAWSFARCAEWLVNTCTRFNQTGPGIRAGARIIDAIGGKAAGEVADFKREEDLKELSEAFENPDRGYAPPLEQTPPGRMFVTYMDAVADALKK